MYPTSTWCLSCHVNMWVPKSSLGIMPKSMDRSLGETISVWVQPPSSNQRLILLKPHALLVGWRSDPFWLAHGGNPSLRQPTKQHQETSRNQSTNQSNIIKHNQTTIASCSSALRSARLLTGCQGHIELHQSKTLRIFHGQQFAKRMLPRNRFATCQEGQGTFA